jgi:TonB family protein
LVLLLAVSLGVPGVGGGQDETPKGADLFRQLEQQTDLQGAGAEPYRLRASFRVLKVAGAPLEGIYQLDWISSSRWREEVTSAGYQEVRVADGDRYWEANSAGRRPWYIRQLSAALNVKSWFRRRAGDSLTAAPAETPGPPCLVLRSPEQPDKRYCFPPPRGQRVQIQSGSGSLSYSDFQPWKQRLFPRRIETSEDQLGFEISVQELGELLKPDASLFVAPASAQARCLTPEMPELLDSREPQYPPNAVRQGTDGIVAVYVRIGTDGKVHDPEIVRTPGPEFNAPTLAAIEQWRFRPASCSGTAVPWDTTIEVAFQLR